MPYLQARDVVARVRKLHEKLRDWCEDRMERSDDPRLPQILDLLRDHENTIQAGLAKVQAGADAAILDTWLQYDTDRTVRAKLEDLELAPDLSVDAIVARVASIEVALGAVYERAATELVAPRVREFFAVLHELHVARGKQYGWLVRGRHGGPLDRDVPA